MIVKLDNDVSVNPARVVKIERGQGHAEGATVFLEDGSARFIRAGYRESSFECFDRLTKLLNV